MASPKNAVKNAPLTVDDAWNAVALEERLELLSRVHADGVLAGIATILLMGTIGYGFNQISLLVAGFGMMFFTAPMFMSRTWRRAKPALILAYLAVRTMARRYAYGCGIMDLDIVLVYRGFFKEVYHNKEVEEILRQKQVVDFDSAPTEQLKQVWICLLRGAVVVLSERPGGAKLEFMGPITNELGLREPTPEESTEPGAIALDGTQISKGRTVVLTTKCPGAHYVFKKQLERLVSEYKPPVGYYRS